MHVMYVLLCYFFAVEDGEVKVWRVVWRYLYTVALFQSVTATCQDEVITWLS